MKLNELQKMIDSDLEIGSELDTKSLEIPKLYHKYSKLLFAQALVVKNAKDSYKRILLEVKQEYLGLNEKPKPIPLAHGRTPAGRLLDDYIEVDDRVVTAKSKQTFEEEKYRYLESTCKEISNMGFRIKNAIDWRKFKNPDG